MIRIASFLAAIVGLIDLTGEPALLADVKVTPLGSHATLLGLALHFWI